MPPLSAAEKARLIELIQAGEPLPAPYRAALFGDGGEYVERTGVYSLEYKGKAREQDILCDTPAAPLQEVRGFNADNPFADGWRNLLVFGDNLLALKALYDDQRGENRWQTRGRIRLVYIDPPFATRQDFMKDREKAYRDKVIGARFIEFLRKRLVLLREVLAEDGFLVVHIDYRFGHYLKVLLDETFPSGFRNDITVPRGTKNVQNQFEEISALTVGDDSLLLYAKSPTSKMKHLRVTLGEQAGGKWDTFWRGTDRKTMRYPLFGQAPTSGQWRWKESRALAAKENYDRYLSDYAGDETLDDYYLRNLDAGVKLCFVRLNNEKVVQYFVPPRDARVASTIWTDVRTAGRQTAYPTEKHEDLLARLVGWLTQQGDIVLDAFMGSGTTLAVAEKLGRRWIGMDCGKLAIYTAQKRLLNLTTRVGAAAGDDRREHERVADFAEHSKSGSRGLLLLFEKAKAGDLIVSDVLLRDLAEFLDRHLPGTGPATFSLACPEEKFRVRNLEVSDDPEELKAGQKAVTVGRITFQISFIEPRAKAEKPKPLKAHEFVLCNAGIYDNDRIKAMPWAEYKPFVMKLFGVRDAPHPVHGFTADGYIGADSAFVWNYPDQKNLRLDEEYVQSLHEMLGGRAGERFYVIAPVVAMGFMTDEIRLGETRYTFLKVPVSVLQRLLESGEPGALKQPASENDVNAVIDAVGFDFVSQPLVTVEARAERPKEEGLFNRDQRDLVLRLKEFRARTLATDPEDFPNFATLSMVLVDLDFQGGDFFSLGKVFWAEDLVAEELKRRKKDVPGEFEKRAEACERLELRIPQAECGKRIMAIFVDRYGNEKKLEFRREEFRCR